MEVSQGLLVAMMFIMVVSIGIGNLLMALPPLVDERVDLAIGRVHLAWLALLLLIHLDLFWQVLLILEVETWDFGGFLYIVTGPILLLLATSLLLPDPGLGDDDPEGLYRGAARRSFTLLALLMAWLVGVEILFGDGINSSLSPDLIGFVLFSTLAFDTRARTHSIGVVVAWLLFASVLGARALGLIT